MKKINSICLPVFFLCLLTSVKSLAQVVNLQPKKKLIDFGWNSPFTYDLRNNLKKYEKAPFDGVGIKLPKNVGGGNIFMVNELKAISNDSMEVERTLTAGMKKSTVLTDNFVVIYGGSQMDWFSDAHWQIVDKQLRYAAQLAKALNCKGILWDPEAYKPGKNPWKYAEQQGADKISYPDYYNQVRKRGAQFIKALQEEFPGLVILSLRELSDYQHGSPFSESIIPITNAKEAEAKLSTTWSGLHLPFTIGILDAIEHNTIFIDGNEDAYYYTSALEFYKIRNTLKNDGRVLVPAEVHKQFAYNYTIAHAISSDYTTGNWANIISFPFRLSGQAKMLTIQQQALWFEHNAYYALETSDQYAWLYTEKHNWWTGANIPKGFEEALIRAKNKVTNGLPLGFNVEDMLKTAQIKAEKFQPEKK